jgi:ABC-type sugar transport system substrate-binding protein
MSMLRAAAAAAVAGLALGGAAATATPNDTVVKTVKSPVIQSPWLKWNKTTCQYDKVSGPSSYTAKLRKTASPITLGFTPETTTLGFDLIMNKSIADAAKSVGIKLTVASTDYPSKTKPLDAANTMTQVKPDVIISGLVVGDLYPAVASKYQKACIPFIDQFAMPVPKPTPMFQTSFRFDGIQMGQAAVAEARKRGWPLKDTWVLVCTDSILSSKPGSIYDIGSFFASTARKGLGIPASQVPKFIECPANNGPLAARTATRNWLTAHPDVKYVVGAAWDDSRTPGMAQALKDAGFGKRAIIVGRATAKDALTLIANGDPIFAADLDMGFKGWGPSLVALAQDIQAGRAVPTLTTPTERMIVGKAAAKALLHEMYG